VPRIFRHGRNRALQKNHSLLAIRHSPFAIVLASTGGSCSSTTEFFFFSARQKPCPPEKPFATRYSPFTIRYRFGFNWRVVLQHDRIFFGTAEAVPSRKTIRYSPLAIRYSLLAAVLAWQEPRPPTLHPFSNCEPNHSAFRRFLAKLTTALRPSK
jgi:hypothetical protein